MTSRERLLCMFDGGVPDRLSCTFLINPYFTKTLSKPIEPIEILKEIGADILDRDCPLPYKKKYKNVKIRNEVIENETRITYETKFGSVWETYAGIHGWGDIPFKKEHFIKGVEDYKILQYILENMEIEPYYEWYEERDKYIGDYGIIVPQITEFRSSLEFLCEDDLERTIYDLLDYPDIVGSFLNTLKQKNIEICKIAVESPAKVFNIWEDSSTTILSPQLFEQYVLPEMEEYSKIVNTVDKRLIHHACGHIKGLLQLIKKETVAAIESITPYSTGDVSIQECAKAWGDRFIMIGGLDPVFLLNCSIQELDDYIVNMLDDIGELKHKLILQNGDSLPPHVGLDKLHHIVNIAKTYKF